MAKCDEILPDDQPRRNGVNLRRVQGPLYYRQELGDVGFVWQWLIARDLSDFSFEKNE
jgi:hypothetical protein